MIRPDPRDATDWMLESLYEAQIKKAEAASHASVKAIHETIARCVLSARKGGGARVQLSLFAKKKRPLPPDTETKNT